MSVKTANQTTPKAFNIFFTLLLAGMSIYFVWWGLDYTEYQKVALFLVATFFGIFMAFNIGGNDVANSFGTSVGAGTLTVTQALAVAAIFEVAGAILAGASVTDTIRSGIVDLGGLNVNSTQFIYVMLSALMASAFWLLLATKKGLPVSTTHAIIGGIVGSSVVLGIQIGGSELALETVKWSKIGSIAISWVVSPLLGGILSYIIYGQIKKHVLGYNTKMEAKLQEIKTQKKELKREDDLYFETLSVDEQIVYNKMSKEDRSKIDDNEVSDISDLQTEYYRKRYQLIAQKESLDTLKALRTFVPMIAGLGAMIMTSLVVFKGLKHTGLNLSTLQAVFVMGIIGALVWLTAFVYTKTIRGKHKENLDKATFILFSWMQVFTACAFAFSHGSNDIANAVGPFVAIMDVIKHDAISASASVPAPVMLTFGVALIVGLWFIGKDVIQTVGNNLAEMHPASGFSAELAAAGVVMGASAVGLPVSSTHILVGAVLGIGMVNKNTNWAMMKPIGLAWIITLPASAVMATISYLILTAIF